MRTAFALLAGGLATFLSACTTSSQAVSVTTTSPTANASYLQDVRSSYSPFDNVPDKDLLGLGLGVCGLLSNGESVDNVATGFANQSQGRFPAQGVSAIFVASTSDLCPKYQTEMQNWVNSR